MLIVCALRAGDYKKLLDVVEIAYSTPDRRQMLNDVCDNLQQIMPFKSMAFLPVASDDPMFGLSGNVGYNLNEKKFKPFVDYYFKLHPFAQTVDLAKTPNQACRITDIISAPWLAETEYSRDFQALHPVFYEMGVFLSTQGDPIGGIGFHRERGDRDFSDREKEICTHLAPHLSRALRNIDLLKGGTGLADEVGIIFMGNDGNVLKTNDEAKRVLKGMPPGKITDPGLSALPSFFRSGRFFYRVRSTPIRWNSIEKMIFLEPIPEGRDLHSRLLAYGLSDRQEEVAILATRGFANRDIAQKLFITEQTVKGHMHDVFIKMRIKSRGELSAKVMGIP